MIYASICRLCRCLIIHTDITCVAGSPAALPCPEEKSTGPHPNPSVPWNPWVLTTWQTQGASSSSWGYPNNWMVYFRDNPHLKWMITRGTPMTIETPTCVWQARKSHSDPPFHYACHSQSSLWHSFPSDINDDVPRTTESCLHTVTIIVIVIVDDREYRIKKIEQACSNS